MGKTFEIRNPNKNSRSNRPSRDKYRDNFEMEKAIERNQTHRSRVSDRQDRNTVKF